MNTTSATLISRNQVSTPLLVSNEAEIGRLVVSDLVNLQAKEAYIESLTIKEMTVLDEENGNGDSNETYEEAIFGKVILNFGDNYNCKYTTTNSSNLVSKDGGLVLDLDFEVPTDLGSKLVCRYLIIDLRDTSPDLDIGVIWPENHNIHWMHNVPNLVGGYFYVWAFQRLTKDLIVGNVSIKIAGESVA